MNYVLYILPIFTLALGYLAGRYASNLANEIRTLREKSREERAKPAVTMGEYTPPAAVGTTTDDRAVGIVESKTPERVAFETEEAIEKEALGR